MKSLVAFDLDGTLALSKQPIDGETGLSLESLLDAVKVAIISGGDWPQFQTQVVSRLPTGADLTRLFIMPTTGTKLYRFTRRWAAVYQELFEADERARIIAALGEASAKAGLSDERIWGERVEDRGSQITYSGLGQQAPLDAKVAWDPDFAKRRAMQSTLKRLLPDLSINVGGSTSIDITRQGIDKAYGMRRLAEHTNVSPAQILFVGDALYPGGNDYPVKAAGIDTIAVRDVAETRSIVAAVIACLR